MWYPDTEESRHKKREIQGNRREKAIANREKQCKGIRKGKVTSTNGKVVSNMTVIRGVSMQAGPDVTSESCEKLRKHKERRCFWEA